MHNVTERISARPYNKRIISIRILNVHDTVHFETFKQYSKSWMAIIPIATDNAVSVGEDRAPTSMHHL